MLYKFSGSMEASFLFALSALKEWRIDDFDVKQSNNTEAY